MRNPSKKKSIIALVMLSSFSMALPALALPKAYDATVENSQGGSTTHMISDGKGHLRSESSIAGNKYVSIMDLNAKVSYSINDQTKTITKMALTAQPGEDTSFQWQSIGSKVIDGHPCQGRRGTSKAGVTEVWTGDDTGCSVLVTSNGATVQKLKSWSPANPNPSLFVLPTGYKTVDMAELIKNAQSGHFNPADMQKYQQH